MKQLKTLLLAAGLAVVTLIGTASLSVVQNTTTVHADACTGETSIFPRWYDGLCKAGTNGKQTIQSPADFRSGASDPTGIRTFITKIALNIVTIILTIVGYVSLAFIIWGGFKYMISGDNASGISGAKATILNAIIGLVLSIMSVAIVKFVGEAIK